MLWRFKMIISRYYKQLYAKKCECLHESDKFQGKKKSSLPKLTWEEIETLNNSKTTKEFRFNKNSQKGKINTDGFINKIFKISTSKITQTIPG